MSASKKRKRQYENTHRLAKNITDALLLIFVNSALYFSTYGPLLAACLCTSISIIIWNRGVNFFGWLIEEYRGIKHQHQKF